MTRTQFVMMYCLTPVFLVRLLSTVTNFRADVSGDTKGLSPSSSR